MCKSLFACLAALVFSSLLQGETLLETGFRQMYNLNFDGAHRSFAAYQQQQPADPMAAVGDAAAYLFAEFERLGILRAEFAVNDSGFLSRPKPNADQGVKQRFEAALQRAQTLAEAGLKKTPGDPNARLAVLLRLGLHSDYLALIEKRNVAALSEIKQARQMADQLLATHPEYADAYIAIGLENYLLSLKPAPVRWILNVTGAQTDRQIGLEKLRVTEAKGHYLAPYARLLLAIAALRDKDHDGARQRLEMLAREFPGNRLYREELNKLAAPRAR